MDDITGEANAAIHLAEPGQAVLLCEAHPDSSEGEPVPNPAVRPLMKLGPPKPTRSLTW